VSPGEFRLTTAPENRNDILFSNVYMYKGLENRIIIITDIDESVMSNPGRRDSICYSGFSRARNHLILMGEAAALEGIGKERFFLNG
jgi:hypothetical protein